MDEASEKLAEETMMRKRAEQQLRKGDAGLTWHREARGRGKDGGGEEAEGEDGEIWEEEEEREGGEGEDEEEEENEEEREESEDEEEGEAEDGEGEEEDGEAEDGEGGGASVVDALREEVELERILRALAEDGMKAVEQQVERLREEVSRRWSSRWSG
ncbi:hypothetical protein CLOM_g5947 [Closterium sp. NIES-68]|nr:hypothetical protein CLOM_g5947 [Closterium sp. NIES-68]